MAAEAILLGGRPNQTLACLGTRFGLASHSTKWPPTPNLAVIKGTLKRILIVYFSIMDEWTFVIPLAVHPYW